MTGPRALPDPVTFVRTWELVVTVAVAGLVGGVAGWVVARWRGWS